MTGCLHDWERQEYDWLCVRCGRRAGTLGPDAAWIGDRAVWARATVIEGEVLRCCGQHHAEGCTDGTPGCCPSCPINPPAIEPASLPR